MIFCLQKYEHYPFFQKNPQGIPHYFAYCCPFCMVQEIKDILFSGGDKEECVRVNKQC